jgi:hypothetical protein
VSGRSLPASTRQCSCSRDTLDRVQFDIAVVESRAAWWRKRWWHCGCGRARGNKAQVRKKKMMGKQSPKPVPDARLKRDECGRSPLMSGGRVSEMFAHA